MLERERQQLILDILEDQHFASVRFLSDQLGSSEATIRRDLVKLSAQNRLKKIRGGAETITHGLGRRPQIVGSAFYVDKEKHADTKRSIAKKAVDLCADGDSIIINGGSSTFMMSEFLCERQLNILTNSFYLAQDLIVNSDNQVTLPGGEIYRKQGIVLSAFENDTIQYYHGSKMFMGTPGINQYGVMESDALLIRTEQKLHKQADNLIILADSSKIGVRSNFIFATLDEVDTLITDDRAEDKDIQMFEQHDIEIITVESCDE